MNGKTKSATKQLPIAIKGRYANFAQINGDHPLKTDVPDGFMDYQVHTRHDGSVFFFNFELAREMGLIPAEHQNRLNKELIDALLYTFSIQIINEYDIEHNIDFPEQDIRPNKYMATRYLQLQHPNKRGVTSGDGRSIWNGCFKGRNTTWDISSCGTGATSLSPATAIEGKNFKTGNRISCYGCGRASAQEGLGAAVNSELFYKNGIETERLLAIIRYQDGSAVNVRASKNLLRPAHLFRYLKQNNRDGLKNIVDHYIKRQITNKQWPQKLSDKQNYRYLLKQVTHDFAKTAAKLESEYVFCWMEWDGDNILMDGGIIDFGSIRQFGLFHREYRYEDSDRMSTTIAGQKNKARYIVQTFSQLTEFLCSGKKKNIKQFAKHASVNEFERIYTENRERQLLYRTGFDLKLIDNLYPLPAFRRTLRKFMKKFSYFERVQSGFGPYYVTDGICSDAIFCMRDLLRELPLHYLQGNERMSYPEFIEVLRSEYASDEDVGLYSSRKHQIRLFQKYYRQLISQAATHNNKPEKEILDSLGKRSAIINRYERATGDALIVVTTKLSQANKELGTDEMYRVFRNFIEEEILVPEHKTNTMKNAFTLRKEKSRKALKSLKKIVREYRYGI